jgi:hypothetical protein
MPGTAIEADIMMALVLASDPGQVGITRCLVRAALEYRGLGRYAPEAEIIASRTHHERHPARQQRESR